MLFFILHTPEIGMKQVCIFVLDVWFKVSEFFGISTPVDGEALEVNFTCVGIHVVVKKKKKRKKKEV